MSSSEDKVRTEIVRKYCENRSASTLTIAKSCKTTRRTVNRVIKRFLESGSTDRKVGTGKKKKVDTVVKQKISRALKRNPCLSVRALAKKFNTSKSKVQRIKKELNLRTFKKYKVPRREDLQQDKAICRSRKLYSFLLNNSDACIVLDDETYCQANFQCLPGNQFYSSDKRGNVDKKFKTIPVEKFPKKFMIWQAICQCGKWSKPYITSSTMKTDNYKTECLDKILLPFIRQHKGPTIFWPDLASCHYSRSTIEWYRTNQVNFVPKDINPPNCPELRPIERYWAIMKTKLRMTTKEAKGIEDLKKKWNRVLH